MASYNEYGFITALDEYEIFVFGSNLAGRHGKGAAKQAWKEFGARYGVGEGLTGRCYAFPTLDEYLQPLEEHQILDIRNRFYNLCYRTEDSGDHETVFLLTKVGCGLAGIPEGRMQEIFKSAPSNVVKPKDWQ